MKVCSRCGGDPKPDVDFGIKRKTKSGEVRRQPYCKKCNREYCKEHYRRNKAYYLKKSKRHRAQVAKIVNKIKADAGCSICKKEFDPVVLDFDHRPGTTKITNVSTLLVEGRGLKAVMAEIKKCDVICANCHRRLTAARRKTAL